MECTCFYEHRASGDPHLNVCPPCAEQKKRSNLFGELMAVIHKDGGHYLAEHGPQKACGGAVMLWYASASLIERQALAVKGAHESLTELQTQLDSAKLQLRDTRAERDALLAELDEASPKRKCDRCGKEFRMHQLIYEEGDELECWPCNDRENARERAALAAQEQKS